MNKLLLPVLVIAVLIAFYEQDKEQPNVLITAGAVIVFMYCMMRLSARTPSKNQNEDDDKL